MSSRPAVANKLTDGIVVACYGCGRAGIVQGPEVQWFPDLEPKPGARLVAAVCPACWREPKAT